MIEFFSGIGGMRLAVENALTQQSEQDDDASSVSFCQAYDIASLHANQTYENNFEKDLVCSKLVEQLKSKDLDGKADLWTMSPQYQPFTATHGAKVLDIDDKRCNSLKAIMRLLTDIKEKPRYILLEDVKGFATSRMVEKWHECLEENGYTWRQYLVSPIQLNIPNHRQRYYIMCEHSSRWKSAGKTPAHTFTERPTSRRPIYKYIDKTLTEAQLADVLVPDSLLQQNWARHVSVVTAADTATHCFTAGYGTIFNKATGSLLLMPSDEETDQEAIAAKPLDRSNMLQYSGHLRSFTPKELLALFGFPSNYEFPTDISLEHQFMLIGNSINVTVATQLLRELLFGNEEEEGLAVGGTKGHTSERIDGNLFRFYEAYRWKMIPNCTGRYVCREHSLVSPLPPIALLERAGITTVDGSISLQEFHFVLPDRPDEVVVVPLDHPHTTGVISFVKDGPSYVHTLNTPSGFRRKLEAIGIKVTDTDICLAENEVYADPDP
jgi:tRNA (cytosine38-C5)-methyltransferase